MNHVSVLIVAALLAGYVPARRAFEARFSSGAQEHDVHRVETGVSAPAQRQSSRSTVRIGLVEIPPGHFMMGSPSSEVGRGSDELQHEVTISRPFFLGRFEVTQQEWRDVMGAAPSHFADCGLTCPVEQVNFLDIKDFLSRLNDAEGPFIYRLPTEAEWEYACRAGTVTPFSTGENLTTDQANYDGRFPYRSFAAGIFRGRPTPVGTLAANAWGVADMHGNLWEWTSDWYGPYPADTAVDPHGAPSGTFHVIRGGSWLFDANSARCALRYTHRPIDHGFSLGFRVAADRRTP